MLHPIVLVACVLVGSTVSGRPPQHYLPSNQYLAPQTNQLHYHGVSGHPAAKIEDGRVVGAEFAGHGQQRQLQIPIVRSDYQNDAKGNYNFGFDTANGIHRDEIGEFKGGWPHGSLGVRGSYSYTGDDGKRYTVNYKADKNGFHAEGIHLPTSPSLPVDHQRSAGGFHGSAHKLSPSARYLPGYRQRRQY